MSHTIRRGRTLYIIIATLIILDCGSSIIYELVKDAENFSLRRDVFQPGLYILGYLFLWRGDTWLRWMVALGTLFQGAVSLLLVGAVLYHIISRVEPEGHSLLSGTTALVFGPALPRALFYIGAGLALVLPTSVRAFLQYQADPAESHSSESWDSLDPPQIDRD